MALGSWSWFRIASYAALIAGGAIALVIAVPRLEPLLTKWINGSSVTATPSDTMDTDTPTLAGPDTIRVSQEVVRTLRIELAPSRKVTQSQPLPPQTGTLNYD